MVQQHPGQSETPDEVVRRINALNSRIDDLERQVRSQMQWAVCVRHNPSTIDVSVQNSNGIRTEIQDVAILNSTHPVSLGDGGLLIRLPSQRKLFIANPFTYASPSSRSLGSVFSGTITKLWYQDATGAIDADIPVLAEVRLIHNPDVKIMADIPNFTPGTAVRAGSLTDLALSTSNISVGRRVWIARDSGIAVWRLNAIEPYSPRHVIFAVMQFEGQYQDTTPSWPTGYENPYQYGKPTGIVSLADLAVTGTSGLTPEFDDNLFVYDIHAEVTDSGAVITATRGNASHELEVLDGQISSNIQSVVTESSLDTIITLAYLTSGVIASSPLRIQLYDTRGNETGYIIDVSRG